MSNLLELKNIRQGYGSKEILRDLSLKLEEGKIGCILGPSGSGKTTLLRSIAGFEDLSAGEIRIHQTVVSQPGYTKDPYARKVGIVFQDFALFPHLTVEENIAAGLRGKAKNEIKESVQKWVQLIGLESHRGQYPHELSGGESQRVALARAMAPQPSLLLMDEPFSNLDGDLREHLSAAVRVILRENQMTALIVTHDQDDAFAIADKVGVFNEGKIEQWGTPYDLYHKPTSRFVADFIGQGVFVTGKAEAPMSIATELGLLKSNVPINCQKGCTLQVLLRPDDVVHDDESAMQAKVLQKTFRGAYILYTLGLESGSTVLAHVPSHHDHAIGSSIGIKLEADHVIWFCDCK